MTNPFELRHQSTWKGIVNIRILPLVLAATLLAASVASLIALATQDLAWEDLVTAVGIAAACTAGAGFVLYRAWRTWPAVSSSLVVIRLDQEGPHLRKGRYRDDTWYGVTWSTIQAVTYTPLLDPRISPSRRLRVLRFVPHPSADVPDGHPGAFDHLLGLPPRESVLAFVASHTWDDDLRELLAWIRLNHPELRVEDGVPAT